MRATKDSFTRAIVNILAKRAANICSNPECRAITSGPAKEDGRVIMVGEAAHVYGARPGSARYDPLMSSTQRRAITNAVWLCKNCHKIADDDSVNFSPSLLFEWRNIHEKYIMDRLGKTNDILRRRLVEEEISELNRINYTARQILIDRPYAWEYRLTAEVLKCKLNPILLRARSLEKGLYCKPIIRLKKQDAYWWFQERIVEMGNIAPALSGIINSEFQEAWGAPGVAGSPADIIRVCSLFEEACDQILLWEEKVKFTLIPDEFQRLSSFLSGIGTRLIDQVGVVPQKLNDIFDKKRPDGHYKINITIDLPDGWYEKYSVELENISDGMMNSL